MHAYLCGLADTHTLALPSRVSQLFGRVEAVTYTAAGAQQTHNLVAVTHGLCRLRLDTPQLRLQFVPPRW